VHRDFQRPSLLAFRPLFLEACGTSFLDERLLLLSGHPVNLLKSVFAPPAILVPAVV
jgi:hypothetical protein